MGEREGTAPQLRDLETLSLTRHSRLAGRVPTMQAGHLSLETTAAAEPVTGTSCNAANGNNGNNNDETKMEDS